MTPGPKPFSPFLRLLIGAAATALVAEWARFQTDLTWAALPVGVGAVITAASAVRGVRARRAWRHAAAQLAAAEADRAAGEDLPLPQGAGPSPLDAAPATVDVRRDAKPQRPRAPLIDADDVAAAGVLGSGVLGSGVPGSGVLGSGVLGAPTASGEAGPRRGETAAEEVAPPRSRSR